MRRGILCRRAGVLLLAAALVFLCAGSPAEEALPLQLWHRVTNTFTETTQANKSVVKLWQVQTECDPVTQEINAIAQSWADELAPGLEPARSNKKNSRLDVEIRYSRTGLTWMSFMVQARTTLSHELKAQRFVTRTYDMLLGDPVTLKDIFGDSAEAWNLLAGGVRTQLTAYWPGITPNPAALDDLCAREALEKAEFTLHGMSLVLHYPADALYPDRHTLMEVTFFYPDIRQYMTDKAKEETDNLKYYRTCALTFDDGPAEKNSNKVMDSLMETGARATFFVIGNRIEGNRSVVQREHDDGHAVASHNWHHGNANKSSPAALRRMPERVNDEMTKTIGIPVRYDRVPGGLYPPMVKAGVNWAYIQWSLDTYDWRGYSTTRVVNKVKKAIRDGDIILCHDIKDNTPESARQIVRYLEENGYLLLTIDELFAKDGVELKPHCVYYRCVNGDTSKRSD